MSSDRHRSRSAEYPAAGPRGRTVPDRGTRRRGSPGLFVRSLRIVLFLLLGGLGTPAGALTLGTIEAQSTALEPLKAEILLILSDQDPINGVLVNLASPEEFREAGLERPRILEDLSFRPKRKHSGQTVIEVTSTQPIRQSDLSFIIQVQTAREAFLREFRVYLKPPRTDRPLASSKPPTSVKSGPLGTLDPSDSLSLELLAETIRREHMQLRKDLERLEQLVDDLFGVLEQESTDSNASGAASPKITNRPRRPVAPGHTSNLSRFASSLALLAVAAWLVWVLRLVVRVRRQRHTAAEVKEKTISPAPPRPPIPVASPSSRFTLKRPRLRSTGKDWNDPWRG